MKTFTQTIQDYDYDFPQELIAQTPASPRDSARLLVYNKSDETITHDTFKKLIDYIPSNSVVVLNQTKVIPARLTITKPSGGQARILYISKDTEHIRVLSDRNLVIGSTVYVSKKVFFDVISK
ncbi:MAG: S-adenosylmethionine:tRNA ribosyltransferase-isomerase, partial [bacterium]|nr:S-adenosylmethionine:tRNA ribosyltransferase-isomerase [bacterium]